MSPSNPGRDNPLDTTKFEQDPCGLLSPDQARELANLLTTRLDSKASGGPICSWLDEHHNGISYSLIRGGGLSDAYRNHLPSDPGYFEPGENAAGHPGVYASITDGRPQGDCVLMVGLRNDVVMVTGSILGGTSPDQKNPCPLVKKAEEGVPMICSSAATTRLKWPRCTFDWPASNQVAIYEALGAGRIVNAQGLKWRCDGVFVTATPSAGLPKLANAA